MNRRTSGKDIQQPTTTHGFPTNLESRTEVTYSCISLFRRAIGKWSYPLGMAVVLALSLAFAWGMGMSYTYQHAVAARGIATNDTSRFAIISLEHGQSELGAAILPNFARYCTMYKYACWLGDRSRRGAKRLSVRDLGEPHFLKPVLLLRAGFPGMSKFVPKHGYGDSAAAAAFENCAQASAAGWSGSFHAYSLRIDSQFTTVPYDWLVWRDLDAIFLAAADWSLEKVVGAALGACHGDPSSTGRKKSATARRYYDIITTDPVNSGVLFVRPTPRSALLLCDWVGRAHLKPYSGRGLRDQPLLEDALRAQERALITARSAAGSEASAGSAGTQLRRGGRGSGSSGGRGSGSSGSADSGPEVGCSGGGQEGLSSPAYEEAVCRRYAELLQGGRGDGEVLGEGDRGRGVGSVCVVDYGGVLGEQWPWYSSKGWLLHAPGLRYAQKVEMLRSAGAEADRVWDWKAKHGER